MDISIWMRQGSGGLRRASDEIVAINALVTERNEKKNQCGVRRRS